MTQWRSIIGNRWKYDNNRLYVTVSTTEDKLYGLVYNGGTSSINTYRSDKCYVYDTECYCDTTFSLSTASFSITDGNTIINYNKDIYSKDKASISLYSYMGVDKDITKEKYIYYNANKRFKYNLYGFKITEYDFNANGHVSYYCQDLNTYSIGWRYSKDTNNKDVYEWSDRGYTRKVDTVSVSTLFKLTDSNSIARFDENYKFDIITVNDMTYSSTTDSLPANIKYGEFAVFNMLYKKTPSIDVIYNGNTYTSSISLSNDFDTSKKPFGLSIIKLTNGGRIFNESSIISNILNNTTSDNADDNITFIVSVVNLKDGEYYKDDKAYYHYTSDNGFDASYSAVVTYSNMEYIQDSSYENHYIEGEKCYLTVATASTGNPNDESLNVSTIRNFDYYPIGGEYYNKTINIGNKVNNFIYKFINYSYFNLKFSYSASTSSIVTRMYLANKLPSFNKDNRVYPGILVGTFSESKDYEFYGLYGNKYLYFVAPVAGADIGGVTQSIGITISNVQIIGGYNEKYTNVTISTYTLDSIDNDKTSTYSFVHGFGNNLLNNTPQKEVLHSKIGNGVFKAGVWENGVWNNGLRTDNTLLIFYDITSAINDNAKSNDWYITLIGSTYSTSQLKVGDKLSIGNIVSIDMNDKRSLMKNTYIIQSIKDDSIVVKYTSTFPIKNIKRDSDKHRIYVSKNIWLNGSLFNGVFNGIWTDGTVKGFPIITKMYDTEWIDGTFDGGRFMCGMFNSTTCSIAYTYSTTKSIDGFIDYKTTSGSVLKTSALTARRLTGKIIIDCGSKKHFLSMGDSIVLTVNDGKKYKANIIKIYSDYKFLTDIDFNTSGLVLTSNTVSGCTVSSVYSNGLMQNVSFNSNNISDVTSVNSDVSTDVFLYDSWMDINYYDSSAVNIGKDVRSNNMLYKEKFSTLEGIYSNNIGYTMSNTLDGAIYGENNAININSGLLHINKDTISISNALKGIDFSVTTSIVLSTYSIIKKYDRTFSENNLYGYPTDDILSSTSLFRNSYDTNVKSYKLGTKYTIYHDYIGEAGEFKEYFTDFNNTYMQENGWTYSTYQNSSIIFNRTMGEDTDGESMLSNAANIKNKELKVTSYNQGGRLDYVSMTQSIITDRYNGKLENGRYTFVSFDLLTYSTDGYLYTNPVSDYYPQIHFNNLNSKRITTDIPKFTAKAKLFNSNLDVIAESLDKGSIKNIYDDTMTLQDKPFTYLPIYKNIDHVNTQDTTKVEYFYNKTEMDMTFRGGNIGYGNSQYVIDNLHFYETDMIPFFKYFTEYNIDKGVVVPYNGIAPYIDYADNISDALSAVNYNISSVDIS